MRRVLSFLVWLFSFWTWKDFFLRWLQSPTSHPSGGETAEHLPSREGQPESELARFSISGVDRSKEFDTRYYWKVEIEFGSFPSRYGFKLFPGTDEGARYREFLKAVASSGNLFLEEVGIGLDGDDSCQHVEAFADALRQSGNGFRRLNISGICGSAVRLAKCVPSLLLGNDAIEDLRLDFWRCGGEMDAELIAIIVGSHRFQTLKSFRMQAPRFEGVGMEQLLKPFEGPSSVLENLDFNGQISDTQVEHIGGMLASNTSLKTLLLNFRRSEVHKKAFTRGYTSIGAALCSNQSLQTLRCQISSNLELKTLLDPLMTKINYPQRNTTLTRLCLMASIRGIEGIETLVDMIHTNSSLQKLELVFWDDLSSDNIEGVVNVLAILEALKTNKSLKIIDFWGCSAVGGYKVLGAMMDLLLENHCIEDIGLRGTGLEDTGDVDYVYSALSKRRKVKFWDIVQSMANVKPTSGRVFLCGNPYAGKTRLRLSMKKLKEFQQKDEIPHRSQIRGKIQKVLKTSHASKVPIEDKPLERTHGIEVEGVLCDGIGITIWDMAGQTDYHSFHELVMPNLSANGSSSMFLLMCNPMQQSNLSKRRSPSDIKRELETWLRFIASNTRRSLSYRSHVSIVMTHFDYWMNDDSFAQRINEEVVKLKSQFDEILEFDEDKSMFKVDGRNESHARGVFDFVKSHMKQLLERLPKTIRACEEVQRLVTSWNADKSKQRLLKWEEFCEGMCKEVDELNDVDHELEKGKREFVAVSLNDGGHIIYNEKGGVVITNPHWFCHQIVGQFLHQCAIKDCDLEMVSSNGIMPMERMKSLILKLVESEGDMDTQFDEILGMMMKLHICYEQDASSIIIPSTFKDNHQSLSWSTNDDSTSFKYVGRRLACKDEIRTMLTPSFFTRLQVFFFKKLQSKNDQGTYQLFQDLIKFISGCGIEVILEFHDGNIDILLRSHQCEDKMLEFLENKIVMHIKHLQEDPTLGCPGVSLIELILRPKCVRRLVLAKDRKDQCVQVKVLEAQFREIGVGATHNWQSCEGLDIGWDKVSTLLGSLAWKALLERRSCELQDYHKKIQCLGTMTQDDHSYSNPKEGGLWTSSILQMTRRLVYGPLDDMRREIRENHKETMSRLNDIVDVIQKLECGIQNMQRELLREVCSKIDDLMAFSVEMQKSQIPKLADLCELGEKKLLTRFVPDLSGFQLYLMSESMEGFHDVPDQEGCVVYFGTEHSRRFLAKVALGLKIATLLTKIGAHVACGMGSMIPDFSGGGTFAALILDTPGFLDYQIPPATLELLPNDVEKYSRISIKDQSEAQRWLREFLEPKCQKKRDFYEQFRLRKVRYRRARGSIAWICDKCFLLHLHDIDELN